MVNQSRCLGIVKSNVGYWVLTQFFHVLLVHLFVQELVGDFGVQEVYGEQGVDSLAKLWVLVEFVELCVDEVLEPVEVEALLFEDDYARDGFNAH